MASTSSALVSSTVRRWKHSAFLSFSGEDVRYNFLSHLYRDLCKISCDIYIDYRLRPAEEIAPALMKAIEESRIAVIIFSKRYASSTWCLDELERIIECSDPNYGQKVIPVFYNVDSGHVHNPTAGVYADDFVRHEKDFKKMLEKVQRLRTAMAKKRHLVAVIFMKALEKHEIELKKQLGKVEIWKESMIKAASFKGWDSQVTRPDTTLIDEIVNHVMKELLRVSPINLDGLVGIDSRIQDIKELLSIESDDVRLLGIWAMDGMGKTTIATALFRHIWFEFEASCILENIREESNKPGGLSNLRKKLLSDLLGKRNMIPNMEYSSLLQDVLSYRKALIIFDDLTNMRQLRTLIGHECKFHQGSRIIITSSDWEMVGKKGILGDTVYVGDPYVVQKLNYSDAFKLFSQNAFEQKHPTEDFLLLVDSFLKYAGGVPLALEVLGVHMRGRSKESWDVSLVNLHKGPHQGIQSVLRLSYDDLSEDGQNMFLDIACFLNSEDFGTVKRLFEACEYSVDISYLIEKCLVIMPRSDNKVRMHPLFQEMGKEIERKKPLRVRLFSHKDACKVFKRKKELESIESLSLDMSKLREVLKLDPNAFARVPNLKFLKFYTSEEDSNFEEASKVHLLEGLESLPDDLLYLYWYGYPLNSLPSNFDATNLVVLKLPHSNVERLWEEDKELENLKEIDLNHSHSIVEFPSLLQAQYLSHLNFRDCINFSELPSTVGLKFLELLNLSGSGIEHFPEVHRKIKFLYLGRTAIKEVPFSILCLDNLSHLGLDECPNLTNVPFNILISKSCSLFNSTRVKEFTFSNTMDYLPDDPNVFSSITYLDLSVTSFEILPEKFKELSNLRTLFIRFCPNLRLLPELPSTLVHLEVDECRALETISSLNKLFDSDNSLLSSQNFCFTNCPKLDEKIWSNFFPGVKRRIQHLAVKAKEYRSAVEPYFRMWYPGWEIPESFASSSEGNSITIELLPNWLNSNFLGFVLCAAKGPEFPNSGYPLHCKCHFENNNSDSIDIMCCSFGLTIKHVILWYDYNLFVEINKRRDWFTEEGCKVSFEFFELDRDLNQLSITSCGFGVLPLYADEAKMNGLETPSRNIPMKEACDYVRLPSEYCYKHQMDRVFDMQG